MHLLFSERERNKNKEPKKYKKDIYYNLKEKKLAKKSEFGVNPDVVCKAKKGEVQKDSEGNIKYNSDILLPKNKKYTTKKFLKDTQEIIKDTLNYYDYYDIKVAKKNNIKQKHLGYNPTAEQILFNKNARVFNNFINNYDMNYDIKDIFQDKELDLINNRLYSANYEMRAMIKRDLKYRYDDYQREYNNLSDKKDEVEKKINKLETNIYTFDKNKRKTEEYKAMPRFKRTLEFGIYPDFEKYVDDNKSNVSFWEEKLKELKEVLSKIKEKMKEISNNQNKKYRELQVFKENSKIFNINDANESLTSDFKHLKGKRYRNIPLNDNIFKNEEIEHFLTNKDLDNINMINRFKEKSKYYNDNREKEENVKADDFYIKF